MARIRNRLSVIDDVLARRLDLSAYEDVQIEVVFVQFRKCLEEIAFASLSANRDVYSDVYATFAEDWSVRKMLDKLDKVNPDFYPRPMRRLGDKCYEPLPSGYLTRGDLIALYGHSSGVIHARNPYKGGDPTIKIGLTVQEWVTRIKALIGIHYVTLVTGDIILAQVPDQGDVHAVMASAAPNDQA